MGAYFGYSVAAGDIDGDSLDDLIVGAPMYTIPDNPEMNIETGRIYVIYQGGAHEKFRKVDSRYDRIISNVSNLKQKINQYYYDDLSNIRLNYIVSLLKEKRLVVLSKNTNNGRKIRRIFKSR